MSARRIVCTFLLSTSFAVSVAVACGAEWPNSYLAYGSESRTLDMPIASFQRELSRILDEEITFPGQPAVPKESPNSWNATLRADIVDLRQALGVAGVEGGKINEIVDLYKTYRSSEPPSTWKAQMYPSGANPDSAPPPPDNSAPNEPSLTAVSSEALLPESLPDEFAFYARGASAFHKGDLEAAVREWKALLDLPEDNRHFKSTWAAYMIAKALLKTNPATSILYYTKIRDYADAGLHDSLRLADDSFGWQAQAEMYAGEHAAAIRHYLLLFQLSEEGNKRKWYESLKTACWMACKSDQFDLKLAEDSLCQRIIAAWTISNPSNKQRYSLGLYNFISQSGVRKPFPDADKLAWAAYASGDMENTKQWLDLADPDLPYARWTRAKLMLREGRIDEAVQVLHGLTDAFPADDQWPGPNKNGPFAAADNVKADLGVLLLGRGEYAKALDLFVRSGYWVDAAYVAERVLTTSELREFVDAHHSDSAYEEPLGDLYWNGQGKPRRELLRGILARRYLRGGDLDSARIYMSVTEQETISNLKTHLSTATQGQRFRLEDMSSAPEAKKSKKGESADAKRVRALHYIAAAECIRRNGMEFLGSEIEPDWSYLEGIVQIPGPTYHRTYKKDANPAIPFVVKMWPNPFENLNPATAQALSASSEEMRRVWESTPVPNKRFHYRYVAAGLMWKAAQLLPNDDPLIPYALYWGGMWIKNRDPEAADRFYKAMVRRCPNLPYAQEADKLHWFPKSPPPEPNKDIPPS
ncbi:MAG: hypothetical protein K1Y02_14225 [Candidatus Hydrogenedentes bacterium]|nr:hypothetical protein [Candidatus Hydrogenedentota bacterium]